MRFIPRKPLEDVNVSKEHPLVEAGTLVVGLGLIFLGATIVLIFMVEIVLYFVPEETEVRMFESWLPEDIVTVAIDDPRLESLESLVWRLSRHWPETDYKFRVEIDDSPDMNAMAFPGGLIIVTTGLLNEVQTENELAFIVGHEMGHFKNRDHIRGLGRGVVLAIALAAISSNDGSSGIAVSIADLTLRGFGRKQESDADEFGLSIVHQEYGHVADAWRFFERLEEEEGESLKFAQYLSTHPQPEARIEALIEMAGENGWSLAGDTVEIDWEE